MLNSAELLFFLKKYPNPKISQTFKTNLQSNMMSVVPERVFMHVFLKHKVEQKTRLEL